jgi:hypothetical protein
MRILLNTLEEEAAPYVFEQESKRSSLTKQQVLERINALNHAELLEIIQQSSRGLGTDAKVDPHLLTVDNIGSFLLFLSSTDTTRAAFVDLDKQQ